MCKNVDFGPAFKIKQSPRREKIKTGLCKGRAAFAGKTLFDERDAAAREASEAAAKARLTAEEARRDAEGCRRAQAIAAQAPDDEEVEIGDIRRL